VSDIDMRVALAPHPRGTAVELDASLPESEAARLGDLRELVVASLARLAQVTAASGGALG
jgi:hypothetical protein